MISLQQPDRMVAYLTMAWHTKLPCCDSTWASSSRSLSGRLLVQFLRILWEVVIIPSFRASLRHLNMPCIIKKLATIYGPAFKPPSPRQWSWVSHSTVPLPPCGVVGGVNTLYTLHSTLYTPDFTIHTLHFALHSPHSTLQTLHSTLYTLHSTVHTLHFTLHSPHSTLYTLHFTLQTPHFTLFSPGFAVDT